MHRLNGEHFDRMQGRLQVVAFSIDGQRRSISLDKVIADLANTAFGIVLNSKRIVLVRWPPIMHVIAFR